MQPPLSFGISCPTLVRFGAGVHGTIAQHLPQGARDVAFVRGAGGIPAQPVREMLKGLNVTLHEVICAGEPSVEAINSHAAALAQVGVDAVIACGGGAVIDTGKALTFCLAHDLRLGSDFSQVPEDLLARPCPLPLIALPTTAGTGAEVTANAVLDVPEKRAKISLRGRALFAQTALVDPSLMGLAPPSVALHAGLDAVTQIMEAYTSAAATPFSDALTAPLLTRGVQALRGVVEEGTAAQWQEMAWTSLASGLALANGGLGAAHGVASIIGGRYGGPHGALCGRLLCPVLRENRAQAEQDTIRQRIELCCAAIAEVFPPDTGADDLAGLESWLHQHNLPRLADHGVRAGDVEDLATASAEASSSRKNAVPLMPAQFAAILTNAL